MRHVQRSNKKLFMNQNKYERRVSKTPFTITENKGDDDQKYCALHNFLQIS